MAIAKVQFKSDASATPEVWMDTTQKTVEAANLLSGETALKNDGTDVVGTLTMQTYSSQQKSVNPTESQQTVTPDANYDGLSQVTVGAISSTYVGSAIDRNDSTDLTASGATVTVPAGYYEESASKSVASGTAGTPTATKGTVSNHSISVTPSVTNSTGYITGGTKNGTAVSVSASELVSGTLSITSSGTKDVTNYASASVAAGSATTPATSITANPSISVDANGLITASASASKNVTPTVSAGYVSSGTAGTVSVSGSNTKQLSTQAATTITPTETEQTAVTAGKYTTGAVKVAAISSDYVGSGVERRDDTDLTASGATVTVPAGYYEEQETKSVATTTHPNPTASVDSSTGLVTASHTQETGYVTGGTTTGTLQLSTQAATTITPSTTSQTAVAAGKYTTGAVTVDPIPSQYIVPTGTKEITENGTGIDVTQYASVDVDVEGVVVSPLSVSLNGVYTAPTGTAYSPVTVNVEGGYPEEKSVNFIDYDGTILYSYTAAEANALTALPANPGHSGLISQGWNWTLTEIKAQLTAQPDEPVWVGQMYITSSGATEIDVTMIAPDLHPYLCIAVNGTVTIDWGDNTTADTMTGTSDTTPLLYMGHEYAAAGNYTISISVVSGTFGFSNNSGYAGILIDQNSQSRCLRYSKRITSIRLGQNACLRGDGFSNTVNLKTITIPSGTSANIDPKFVFQNASGLISITLPSGFDTIDSQTFSNCYNLQTVSVPPSVTSIGSSAFSTCNNLKSITIPYGITTLAGTVFNYCNMLKSLAFPKSVTVSGSFGVRDNKLIKKLTVPDGVTTFASYAFYGDYVLDNINIPDGVTSIPNYAFESCYALDNIEIPEGVATIGNYAFRYCRSLSSITIPENVTSIGTNAFYNCYGISEMHFKPTTPPTVANSSAFAYAFVSGATIYVPTGCLEAYTSATNYPDSSTYTYVEE